MISEKFFAALAPLVGNRVYPVQRPQGSALPAITYTHIANTEDSQFTHLAGYQRYRVQLDVYAATWSALLTLRPQIIAAMEAVDEFIERGVDSDGDYNPDDQSFHWQLEFIFRERIAVT